MLEELRPQFRHTIQVVTEPTDDLRYNCVMYAFGIERDEEYVGLVLACPLDVHGDTLFVQYLLEKGDLTEIEEPKSGALAIYSDEERIRHIGRVTSKTRVTSKWGIGELYEHDTFDVPKSYGDNVRYFRHPGRDTIISRFIEFAEGKGVRFEGNDG